ncbi:MAG: peptide-methionine (S)-S-oxide reductase MsrA [Patescibacteria group bacterium]
MENKIEIAVFGGGCFWCTEAVFQSLKGILSIIPGYSGGSVKNPTYENVCGGKTGHAEVTKIEYNPNLISYEDLLTVFFATHDPTTLNRQGNDVGTQYRSIIFYASSDQKQSAEKFVEKLNNDEASGKIVTEIQPLGEFYKAEDYHQKYYEQHKDQPYCALIISPKLEKLKEKFSSLLKSGHEK